MLSGEQFPWYGEQDRHDPNQYVAENHYPVTSDQGELLKTVPYKGGYSPDRAARVAAVMPQKSIGVRRHRYDTGIDPNQWREAAFGAIASSTVPAAHLQGLKLTVGSGVSSAQAGNYDAGKKAIRALTFTSVDPAMQQTLVHEIGHHVDNMGRVTGNLPLTNLNVTATKLGQVEGFADAYAARNTSSGAEGYSPRGMASYAQTRQGTVGETLGQRAYVDTTRKYGQEPNAQWDEKVESMDRARNRPLDQLSLFPEAPDPAEHLFRTPERQQR